MKKGIIFLLVLLLAAGGAGGWYYYQNGSFWPAGRGSKETVYVSSVETLMGTASGVQERYAGVVEPQDTVEIQVDSGRKVGEVLVKVGQEVKEGELLFEYDLTSIQQDLQQAELDLERLKNEAVSLTDQIATLEKEKAKASADNQLSYTVEIETNKMNLKKNEYDQKKKEAEVQRLQNATGNTQVRSQIDGIIQKIDSSKINNDSEESVTDTLESSSDSTGGNDSSNAFITILSTGAYRIKGQVNELNISDVVPGEPVIIRSRVDETQIWHGTMGNVDMEHSSSQSTGSNMWGLDSTGDSQTSSSSYPFYVQLDTSEGLMLGQHVYIERDDGQESKKSGLWLIDFFIADAGSEEPYVWAADDKNHLEKRKVVLGEHDEELSEYEILDGLSEDDYIAFPAEWLEEGMNTVIGTREQTLDSMSMPLEGETDYQGSGEDSVYDDSFQEPGGYEEFTVDAGSDGDFSLEQEFIMEESDGEMPVVVDESGGEIPAFTDEGQEIVDEDSWEMPAVIEDPDGIYVDEAEQSTDNDTDYEMLFSDDLEPVTMP